MTSYNEWEDYVSELEREIYQIQSNALEAKSWEEVQFFKGYAAALARTVNLREDTKSVVNMEERGEL